MPRIIARLIMLTCCILLLGASPVFAHDDISLHRSCSQCGMDRKMYGYSRMLIRYEDGTSTGVCSIHCAVTAMNEHKDTRIGSILVADRESRELILADKAFWVTGGRKRGVMTGNPKWAFATSAAAAAFIAANGGQQSSWNEVLAAAREDAAPMPRR